MHCDEVTEDHKSCCFSFGLWWNLVQRFESLECCRGILCLWRTIKVSSPASIRQAVANALRCSCSHMRKNAVRHQGHRDIIFLVQFIFTSLVTKIFSHHVAVGWMCDKGHFVTGRKVHIEELCFIVFNNIIGRTIFH